jgi:Transposase DDE domain
VPALRPYIIEPIFEQFEALLPEQKTNHPLGCHKPRIPDRVVFGKLVEVLVFGCAYWRIADESCSESTLRRRRNEWIELGVMEKLREIALEAYDRLIGLEMADLSVDARGIPLGCVIAPANRHDSLLLEATLDTLEPLAQLPDRASVHLDRAYDSKVTRRLLEERSLVGVISEKDKRAPLTAGLRWVVERTNSWHNAHKKLVWCTERDGRVIDFWVAFSDVVIIVRRLIRVG